MLDSTAALLLTALCLMAVLLSAADSDDLVLASYNFTVGQDTQDIEVPVELGLLSVEAAFDKLAWSGMYSPRPRHSTSTIIIHAVIVGAQVCAAQLLRQIAFCRLQGPCQPSSQYAIAGLQLPHGSNSNRL